MLSIEEEAAAGAPVPLVQRCNLCWNGVCLSGSGQCFRTTCRHIFCESCAYNHFGEHQTCPSCGRELRETDVCEVSFGLPPSQDFTSSLYQELYKEAGLGNVGGAAVEAAGTLVESVAFVLEQLTLNNQRLAGDEAGLRAEAARQKHENGRLRAQLRSDTAALERRLKDAEHKLSIKERDLHDLQTAYREKLRKCQAWEQAYNELRARAGDGRSRNGSISGVSSGGSGGRPMGAGGFLSLPSHGVPRSGVGIGSGGGGGGMQRAGTPQLASSPPPLRMVSPQTPIEASLALGQSYRDGTGGGGPGGGGGGGGYMPPPHSGYDQRQQVPPGPYQQQQRNPSPFHLPAGPLGHHPQQQQQPPQPPPPPQQQQPGARPWPSHRAQQIGQPQQQYQPPPPPPQQQQQLPYQRSGVSSGTRTPPAPGGLSLGRGWSPGLGLGRPPA